MEALVGVSCVPSTERERRGRAPHRRSTCTLHHTWGHRVLFPFHECASAEPYWAAGGTSLSISHKAAGVLPTFPDPSLGCVAGRGRTGWSSASAGLTPLPPPPQISIVELEKSQRQQELLQLKSCVPPDDALSAHLRGKGALGREPEAEPSRLHLDLDCSRFPLPHFSSASPELSMNGHAAGYELCGALSRPSSKQNTPQYLASPLDQEAVPCTPSHSSRPRLEKVSGLALPDYTRLSPAKLVLRRHLSQDHAAGGKAASGELHPR